MRLDAEAVYSLVYSCACFFFVVPPQEIVQAGITIQNLFAAYLGDEKLDFIRYHARRGSLTLFVHSLLPLGYYLVLVLANPSKYLYGFFDLSLHWQVFLAGSLALPVSAAACIKAWSLGSWSYHPTIAKLKHAAAEEGHTETIISSINTEIRRPERFDGGHYSQKVYVTESWIIKVGTYGLDVVHQSNCVVSLHASQQYQLSESSAHGVQMLDIDVIPVNTNLKKFGIRLNAELYAELKTMLQAPLVNARNVVVVQTITEQFVRAFEEIVNRNDAYRFDSFQTGHELEPCIGCMQEQASIKLVKKCGGAEEGECRPCYCRPLWCLACMAKWFCNRQDPGNTANWLSGRAGCPMCRATFCMADVCRIEIVQRGFNAGPQV